MATKYPKAGKGSSWTVRELTAITPALKGDSLSDGDGLIGEVRVSTDDQVSVRFKYAFKWEGKLCWFQCGIRTVSLSSTPTATSDQLLADALAGGAAHPIAIAGSIHGIRKNVR